MLTDEYRYRILKIIERNPSASQRQIARELDISLGRVNFCLQALIEKGMIKVENFRNSQNKCAYFYLLTRKGIDEKAKVTVRFLKRKLDEYETLKRQVAELQREAGSGGWLPVEKGTRSRTFPTPRLAGLDVGQANEGDNENV